MARNVSADTREAIYASQTDRTFLVCMDIDHSSLGTPFRVVNNKQSIVHNGNTYLATSFEFTPPIEEDGTISNPTVTIDNVDRFLMQTIRSISTPPTLTVFIVSTNDLDAVELGPWEFSLRNVTYDVFSISGTLMYNVYLSDRISRHSFSPNLFPGLQ